LGKYCGEKKKRRGKKMHTAKNIIGKDRIALLGLNPSTASMSH
jgi:hypothetical protein